MSNRKPSAKKAAPAVAAAQVEKPEWLRIDAAKRIFGISRSRLYELIEDKKVKSVNLRERNKVRGIRLVSYDSLNELMERAAAGELI